MFTQDSIFNSNELLSMRVLASLQSTYKVAYEISSDYKFSQPKTFQRDRTRDL